MVNRKNQISLIEDVDSEDISEISSNKSNNVSKILDTSILDLKDQLNKQPPTEIPKILTEIPKTSP